MNRVRVRIAPSPTGDPHVGTAYIALFNYVFAKKHEGDFIIRIEDTDRERFNATSEMAILKYLKWLELDWVEGPDVEGSVGPYRQSDRSGIYKKYVDELLEKNMAYKCFCSAERLTELRDTQRSKGLPPGYDGCCRNLKKEDVLNNVKENLPFIVRLRMPSTGQTIVKDLLRGDVTFDNIKMDDQVLLKSDGMPTYHLANVVDDHLMNITHVIRAEEWIPSTPKHIVLYRAFGWQEPVWVHMPLLRNSDKSKISKRKNDVSLEHYYNEGYLKESMLNFLALMGWHPDGTTEVFSVEDMIQKFDFEKVHLGSPIFDVTKLNWINREHMKQKSLDELLKLAKPFYKDAGFEIEDGQLKKVISSLREGFDTFKDLVAKSSPYLNSSLVNFKNLSEEEQIKGRAIFAREETPSVIKMFLDKLKSGSLDTDEDGKIFIEAMKSELELGPGKILPVIRLLSTGHLKGPETFKVITTIPKIEIEKRAQEILNYVS